MSDITQLDTGLTSNEDPNNQEPAPFNLGGKLGSQAPNQDPPQDPPTDQDPPQDPENQDPPANENQEPTELTEEQQQQLQTNLEALPEDIQNFAKNLSEEAQVEYINTMTNISNYIDNVVDEANTTVNQLQSQLNEFTPIESSMNSIRRELPTFKDSTNAELMSQAHSMLEIKNDFHQVGPLEMALYMIYDHYEKAGRDAQGNPIVAESQLGPAMLQRTAEILSQKGIIESLLPAIRVKAGSYKTNQQNRDNIAQDRANQAFEQAVSTIRQDRDFGPYMQKLESTNQGRFELSQQLGIVQQMFPQASDAQKIKETIKRAANQLGIRLQPNNPGKNTPNKNQTQNKQPPTKKKTAPSFSDYRKNKQGNQKGSFQGLLNQSS